VFFLCFFLLVAFGKIYANTADLNVAHMKDSNGYKTLMESAFGVLLLIVAWKYDSDRTQRIKDLKEQVTKASSIDTAMRDLTKENSEFRKEYKHSIERIHTRQDDLEKEEKSIHESLRSLHKRFDLVETKFKKR
jgi:hypothetical protein